MIKNFKKFIESISGTELIGSLGPGFPEQKLPNTISSGDTDVLYSDITGIIYSKDQYDDMYNDYLKKGGKPLPDGFTKENLEKIIAKK